VAVLMTLSSSPGATRSPSLSSVLLGQEIEIYLTEVYILYILKTVVVTSFETSHTRHPKVEAINCIQILQISRLQQDVLEPRGEEYLG
jgi:hypothetical protein